MQLLDHLAELAGRGGEIEEQVPAQRLAAEAGELLRQRLVGRGGRSGRPGNRRCAAKTPARPASSTGLVRENWSSADRSSSRHEASVFSRRAKPMIRKAGGHLLLLAKVVQGGNELARGQVAARAEDDDRAGFHRLAPLIQAADHQVIKLLGLVHAPTIVEGAAQFQIFFLFTSGRWPIYIARHQTADVAELADALDSKSGTRKSVWVRPPPSAPLEIMGRTRKPDNRGKARS